MAQNAPRVGEAAHLGWLLTRDPKRDAGVPDYAQVNAMLERWRHERVELRSAASSKLARRGGEDQQWEPAAIKGFAAELLHAARELRAAGLPAGHP